MSYWINEVTIEAVAKFLYPAGDFVKHHRLLPTI